MNNYVIIIFFCQKQRKSLNTTLSLEYFISPWGFLFTCIYMKYKTVKQVSHSTNNCLLMWTVQIWFQLWQWIEEVTLLWITTQQTGLKVSSFSSRTKHWAKLGSLIYKYGADTGCYWSIRLVMFCFLSIVKQIPWKDPNQQWIKVLCVYQKSDA